MRIRWRNLASPRSGSAIAALAIGATVLLTAPVIAPWTPAPTRADSLITVSSAQDRQPRVTPKPTRTPPTWSLPVRAGTPVSGYFGETGVYWPSGHAGIDFDGDYGDPIFAATKGRVTYAQYNSGGYGNLVMIMRADGTQTRYAHLDSIAVRVGQRVVAGKRIGTMGATGQATGAHLHFEVRVNSGVTPTDPTSLWSGEHPGIPSPPPAWSCARYGGCSSRG